MSRLFSVNSTLIITNKYIFYCTFLFLVGDITSSCDRGDVRQLSLSVLKRGTLQRKKEDDVSGDGFHHRSDAGVFSSPGAESSSLLFTRTSCSCRAQKNKRKNVY